FLPHDEQFLGMSAEQLCARHGCRIVHFMVHDRISFGGALVAVGLLYLWLVCSPLPPGPAWGRGGPLPSRPGGCARFFPPPGYGYLDPWHGLATLGLLPCFLLGLTSSPGPHARLDGPRCLLRPSVHWPWRSPAGLGRTCLLLTAAGLVCGGLTILVVSMTCVF